MTATVTTGDSVGLERAHGFEVERKPSRRRTAILAVVGGLACVASSTGIALAAHSAPAPRHDGRQAAVAVPPSAPLPNVGTASETYEPGHTSGWHVHPGVHSVVVLGGTLTIYDERCVRTGYAPGETYLGGNAPHLARNERADDLNVAITYVYGATSRAPGTPVAAPAGCDVR